MIACKILNDKFEALYTCNDPTQIVLIIPNNYRSTSFNWGKDSMSL